MINTNVNLLQARLAGLIRILRTPSRIELLFLTALWISLLPNLAALRQFSNAANAGQGLHWLIFVFTGWLFVFAVSSLLIVGLGVFFRGKSVRWLCATCLIVAAILGYYSFFLGIQFDRTMLLNIMQTHPAEAMELLSWRPLLWTLVTGGIPAFYVLTRQMTPAPAWWRSALYALALVLLPLALACVFIWFNYQSLASTVRNRGVSFHVIAPANLVAASLRHAYLTYLQSTPRKEIGTDANVGYALKKPRLVVLVVGETARAKNHALNGYLRDTNPMLRKEDIVYFKDTQSCGTSTAISLPCIFSGLGQSAYSYTKARQQETLVDVVHHAGSQILWRDNDAGCKEVCGAAQVEDFNNSKNAKWCLESGNCFDEILLDGLEDRLHQTVNKDTLLVLHLKGSHGPAYYKRYPKAFEKYTPACQSNELSDCTQEAITNAYDNTILYTDHVLSRVIALLKSQPQWASALLYASDHGESLGEGGLFLHGMPTAFAPAEQTRVPMLAWLSPQYIALENWDGTCIRQQAETPRSHDHIFHTALGLLDIKTRAYQKNLDIFAPCDAR